MKSPRITLSTPLLVAEVVFAVADASDEVCAAVGVAGVDDPVVAFGASAACFPKLDFSNDRTYRSTGFHARLAQNPRIHKLGTSPHNALLIRSQQTRTRRLAHQSLITSCSGVIPHGAVIATVLVEAITARLHRVGEVAEAGCGGFAGADLVCDESALGGAGGNGLLAGAASARVEFRIGRGAGAGGGLKAIVGVRGGAAVFLVSTSLFAIVIHPTCLILVRAKPEGPDIKQKGIGIF